MNEMRPLLKPLLCCFCCHCPDNNIRLLPLPNQLQQFPVFLRLLRPPQPLVSRS